MRLLLKWLLGACALLAIAHVYSGVQIGNFYVALLAAVLLAFLNTVLRPVLIVLTFPVTVLTLGLFLFVINALVFWLAARMVSDFVVPNFSAALLGSLMYTALNLVINSALERLLPR
jgi:putative membrane protein